MPQLWWEQRAHVLISTNWAPNGHRCPEADLRKEEALSDEHLDGGMKKRSGSWYLKHTRNQQAPRAGSEGTRSIML